MSYQVVLKLEAHQDIFKALLWYESKRVGLGGEFYQEIENVKDFLSLNPIIIEIKHKNNVRWIQVDRFPFIVVYVVNEDTVVILAVISTHRHPKRWKSRN